MENNLYPTNTALFGIWDSYQFNTIKDSLALFETFAGDDSLVELMNSGSGVFWSPGINGTFKILVRLNGRLKPEEKKHLFKQNTNNKLVITGKYVILGSPEWAGYKEREGLENLYTIKIPLEKGTYRVDLYCLFRLVSQEEAYFDYIVCLNEVNDNYEFKKTEYLPYLDYSVSEYNQPDKG